MTFIQKLIKAWKKAMRARKVMILMTKLAKLFWIAGTIYLSYKILVNIVKEIGRED